MIDTAYNRIASALRAHGQRVVESSDGHATATCPAHDDSTPSMSVTRSGNRALVWCHSGCDTRDVLAALDLTLGDLYDERAETYRYDDGRTVRRYYDNGRKRFAQTGAQQQATLYRMGRLSEVPAGRSIFLVEGEADVHAIEEAGGVATTAPQGADSFHKVDVTPLTGHWVTCIVDKDEAGEKWAKQVATALHGVAAKYRFMQAKEGKDASDHIAAGHGLTDFEPMPNPPTIDEKPVSAFRTTFVTRSGLRDLPRVEPLIEGIMSRRSAVVLVGATGAGKSFLALAWACCVGTGTPWLGHDVERAKVLYVVGEGASGLDQRISAWERAWGHDVADNDVIFSVKPESLIHPKTWAEVAAESKDIGAGLVIFDTFSSLYPDADETKDAALVTRNLSDLTAHIDGTAVLVHHPGWGDPERTRGGYQLTANVDEVLLLRGTAKEPQLALERLKAKDDALGTPLHLLRKATHGSCIIEGRTAEQAVADAGGSVEDIARTAFHGSILFSKAELRRAVNEARGDDPNSTKHYRHINALIDSGVLFVDGGTDSRPLFRLRPAETTDPFAPQDPF